MRLVNAKLMHPVDRVLFPQNMHATETISSIIEHALELCMGNNDYEDFVFCLYDTISEYKP